MIKNIFFDLDGTLLPMDQDGFLNIYFSELAKKMDPFGYDSKALVAGIWKGTSAMVKNDGSSLNEKVFWQTFAGIFGEKVYDHVSLFDDFYLNEFMKARSACGFDPAVPDTVSLLKKKGYRIVLATNPIFPRVATENRIKWTGLTIDDFEYVTTYENSSYCKPNPSYYEDLLLKLGMKSSETLMVGNDVDEDMIAEKAGMQVFLLPRCIINRTGKDISVYPKGSFDDLIKYIESHE